MSDSEKRSNARLGKYATKPYARVSDVNDVFVTPGTGPLTTWVEALAIQIQCQ